MDYLRYYLNSLIVACGIAGFLLGGGWVWLGVATFIPLFAADLLLGNDYQQRQVSQPWVADLVLYLHVVLMGVLYLSVVFRFQQGLHAGGPATGWHWIGAILSLMWLQLLPNGGIGHELAHRSNPVARRIGLLLGGLVGDPCRDIAHVQTHHIYFDSPRDTDTAYRGENVYQFTLRATLGSFRDAYETEKSRADKLGHHLWGWHSRLFYAVAALAALPLLVTLFSTIGGGLVVIAAFIAAKLVLEPLNYLQHYGLVRDLEAPIGEHHTWNHLSRVIRIIGTEITNHVDHHRDGHIPYYQLVPRPDGAQMPSLFVCFLLCFFPPLWNLFIKDRLREWDMRFASPVERELAREANRKAGWPDWLGEPLAARPAVAAG